MIICPSCQYKEIPGALFCSQCGAQLVTASDHDTPLGLRQKYPLTETGSNTKGKPDLKSTSPMMSAGARISLHLVESGQIVPLAARNEFSLGRVAEGQPIMPDIDLTPYKAYENGVSRLHAILKLVNNQVLLLDLGSSNGTYVNGNRLVPSVERPLNQGDMIHLGKLKIQFLFSPEDK
jgi:pSer/pThr/pTyr-binding forkhead associated (FHA) protein